MYENDLIIDDLYEEGIDFTIQPQKRLSNNEQRL